MSNFQSLLKEIAVLSGDLYHKDFLLTWEKSVDELRKIVAVADALQWLRRENISTRCFESGLAVSIFRDQSTRTRFSFFTAANLLGLGVQDLDEGRSQIAHGETVRETANMIGFFTEFIGIRDDIFLGAGHTYMQQVAAAVEDGFTAGVLEQRPYLVNLQSDIDHPTQSMADLMQLEKPLRLAGQPAGQEDRHDLGLFAQLRQAALRAPGRDRADDALRHGRGAGPSRGLPADPRCGRQGRCIRQGKRRQLQGRELHGRGLCRRRRGLPQELGPLPRHGKAHRAAAQQRHGRAQGAREGVPGQQRPVQGLGVHRSQDEADPRRQGALHALPAGGHLRGLVRRRRGGGRACSSATASPPTSRPASSLTSSPPSCWPPASRTRSSC